MPAEWVRGPQWRSEAARSAWGPAIEVAADAWHQLELLSVSEGLRGSAIARVDAADLPAASRAAAARGVTVTPLDQGHAAFHAAPGHAAEWHRAYGSLDHVAMGRMLGYPACCVEHFAETWGAGRTETVLTRRAAEGPGGTNLMLRWVGVRLVPHLPCSADCAESVDLAQRFSRLATRCGLVEERDAIVYLLSLPVRYSALHGVGVVTTPHFRVAVGTDYTASEVCVAREGDADLAPPAFSWHDCGFRTRAAMEAAHDVVLAAVGAASSALDLGAGDGTLLARLAGGRGEPNDWTGVECDPGRAVRGQLRHPGIRLLVGRIEDEDAGLPANLSFDVVLASACRFAEIGPAATASVLEHLVGTSRLVLTSYDEPLPDAVTKSGLAGKLGPVTAGRGAQAAEFYREGK